MPDDDLDALTDRIIDVSHLPERHLRPNVRAALDWWRQHGIDTDVQSICDPAHSEDPEE